MHYRFGENMEGYEGEMVHFLDGSSYIASAKT